MSKIKYRFRWKVYLYWFNWKRK